MLTCNLHVYYIYIYWVYIYIYAYTHGKISLNYQPHKSVLSTYQNISTQYRRYRYYSYTYDINMPHTLPHWTQATHLITCAALRIWSWVPSPSVHSCCCTWHLGVSAIRGNYNIHGVHGIYVFWCFFQLYIYIHNCIYIYIHMYIYIYDIYIYIWYMWIWHGYLEPSIFYK